MYMCTYIAPLLYPAVLVEGPPTPPPAQVGCNISIVYVCMYKFFHTYV